MPWIEVAQAARIDAYVLDRLPPAAAGSFFANEDLDNLERWCAGLIEAGLSHLLLWADYAVPLKFHPEAETAHSFRPAFTLARAAIECAAQAIWVLGAPDDAETGRRYFSLGIWDLDEQAKATRDELRKAEIRAERDACLQALGLTTRKFQQPLYLTLVRAVAEFVPVVEGDEPMTADRIERIWRSAAGAAHGKQWPQFEIASSESPTPSIEAMSEVLKVAGKLTSVAVLLLAMRHGHDDAWFDLHHEATVHVATTMTTIDGEPIRPEDVPDFRPAR